MELKDKSVEELEARKAEIKAEIDTEGADLDALSEEVRSINEELEARKAEASRKAEIRQAVANGMGEVVQTFEPEVRKEEKMFGVDSIEYRDAWTKSIAKRELTTEERSALADAGSVIPTITVNAVWDKLVKDADLLQKVSVDRFGGGYVKYPVATTVGAAAGQAVGATITESSDVIDDVLLTPNEYVKLLTVGADIDNMAIDALHDWIVDNLTKTISYAINKDVLVGSGSNALKGIAASVNADASALPASITKASILKIMAALGGAYQNGAIWIMTPEMFYENIMSITQLNDYVINDGFQFRLFGHDVVLMSEALISSKETIFYGDPKAYKVNIFKALEVKPFETATTTNIQFRGVTMADGELLDTNAFVRFAQS